MASIKCFGCGRTIEDDVTNCPHCNFALKDKRGKDRRHDDGTEADQSKSPDEERRKKGDRRGFSY